MLGLTKAKDFVEHYKNSPYADFLPILILKLQLTFHFITFFLLQHSPTRGLLTATAQFVHLATDGGHWLGR